MLVRQRSCSVGKAGFRVEDSGEYPCGICRKGVASNSIRCVECLRWVHQRCSRISGKLKTETWEMKVLERMMVRWMCRVSLKDRKHSVDLYSHLRDESVAEVVRRGRLRWFGHVERKNGDDWVLACRNVMVAEVRCAGRGRKTWRECVKVDMDELGLHFEWVVFRDMWRSLISGKTSDPS